MAESIEGISESRDEPDTRPWHPSVVKTELMVHGLFLVLSAAVILMSFLMRREGETAVFLPFSERPLPPSCTTKVLWGIDCPGCGLTRAFISISDGDFLKAWQLNPASFAVYAFFAVQLPWHVLQIGLLLVRGRALIYSWAYYVPIAMVIVMSINWLWRMGSLAW